MSAAIGQASGAPRPDRECGASARKLRWLTAAFLAFLALIGLTLFVHQAVGGGEAAARQRHQAVRLANVPCERAPLLASGGEVLVHSKPVYRLVLDVAALRHPREYLEVTVARVRGRLAQFQQRFDQGTLPIDLSSAAVAEQIRESGPFGIVLNEDWDASPAVVARYARFATEFPEIRLELSYRRECLVSGPLVNTLGRVGWRPPRPVPGRHLWYTRPEMRGLQGIERTVDELVCGTSGLESVRVDALGFHEVGAADRVAPVRAPELRTTIDLPMQRQAEACFLSEGAGAFVVIEVATRKVRAIGGAPVAAYSLTSAEARKMRERANDGVLMDRPRQWLSPPGSVFKMITIGAALASGKLSPDQRLVCRGSCNVGAHARPKACSRAHGPLNAAEALALSCNSFAYEAAKLVGPEEVVRWARRFGIGADPDPGRFGVGVAKSQVMTKDKWYPGDILNLAIGKGDTLTSVVTLANYGCALATDKLMAPVLVEDSSLPEELRRQLAEREAREVGLPSEVQKTLLAGMLACTEMRGGTGRRAACSGLRVLAKTGTAVLGPERKNALMLVLVPEAEPKYCIVCAIENSERGGGGTVGPRMQSFLQELLGLGRLSSGVMVGRL